MSKICISSDWHIAPWSQYSKFDDYGVPDRLMLFTTLVDDVIALCLARDCQALLLAGDMLQTHSPKPMVSNVVTGIMGSLDRNCIETVVIPGNHDVDQKSGRFDAIHSGLASLCDRFHYIRYAAGPELMQFADTKLYAHPWLYGEPDYSSMPDADIFLGHGLVQDAIDPYGHVFQGGYDAERLSEKYRLSVIGDIHKGQVIRGTSGSRVLIPGQPIQINYSSDPNTGIWFLDTADYSLEFVPTAEFPSQQRYHRFLSVDVVPADPAPNYHFKTRLQSGKIKKMDAELVVEPSLISTRTLRDIALDEFAALKPEYAEIGNDLINKAFDQFKDVAISTRVIPRVQIGRIEIHNFYSIPDYIVDLQTMSGDVLIVGPNGAGKSSFMEAVFWCLTGKTTKKTPVNDISNNLTGKPAMVSVQLLIGQDQYFVVRSRQDPLLSIYKNPIDGRMDASCSITKAKPTETQDEIYNIIGLGSAEDILSLVYFSVLDNKPFTEMTPSEQFEFLGRLTDSDQFTAFKAVIDQWESDESAEVSRLNVELSTYGVMVEAQKRALSDLQNLSVSSKEQQLLDRAAELYGTPFKDMAALKQVLESVVASLEKEASALADRQTYDASQASVVRGKSVLTGYENMSAAASKQGDLVKAEIERCTDRLTLAMSAVCPECKQPLHSDVLQKQILEQVQELGRQQANLGKQYDLAEENWKEASVEFSQIESSHGLITASYNRRVSIESQIRQARALLIDCTEARDDVDSKIRMIQDNITNLQAQAAQAQAHIDRLMPTKSTLSQIRNKLLVKNSSLIQQMVSSVYTVLMDTVNSLVGDKGLLYVRPTVGKALGVKVSFWGRKPVTAAGMSAGERRLFDVLVMFALNTLFERRFNIQDGILGVSFYDEIVTYLDPSYLDIVFAAMQRLTARLRIMVTHEENLMSYYDKIIRVSRVDEFTRYETVGF